MSRAVAVRGAVWAPVVVAMMVGGPAGAQEASPVPAQLQRVEVQGDAVAQARRSAVGAMQVLGREELLRQGDTRLADALQRVPGITVLGSGGRGTEIRMSGLGGGYTQLLLNGEPVPPGFSLESLSPELIERVEISRSASVEQSSQAIAGSINIVLRRVPRSGQRSAKLGAATQLGQPTFSADLQLGDRDGALAWGLGLGLSRERQRWPMWMEQRSLDADGRPLQAYTTDKQESERSTRLSLAPQASWTLAPNQTLSTDHLLRLSHSRISAIDHRDSLLGELPQFADNGLYIALRSLQLRSRLSWALSEDDGTKWELKLGLTRQTRDSTADFRGYDYEPRWIRDAQVLSLAVDQGLTLSGRLRKPWRDDHTLSLGWDAEENRRGEDRLQREQPLPGGLPVENLDEIYDARIRRLAMFVQDEWALSPAWTATLGLRWEGLQTISEGNVFEGVKARSSVFSPALQARWRLPGSQDLIRLGLARSYKAPTPRELMPRRFVANNNSATTPDLQGNPALRPELAWGLDAAWEHPLAKGSQLTVSAYLKRIEHVIVDELFQQQGAWVLKRANSGIAWVRGIDLEARLSLPQLLAGAPALDLRANLALNRSRVAAVPGPDNRLAQQTPLSLNLGLDHRPAGSALSWGGNFNYQAGGPQRLSLTRFADSSDRRTLDVYLHWKADAQTQWRLALSNLLHPDQVAKRRVLEGGREHLLSDTLRTGAGIRLTLERAL